MAGQEDRGQGNARLQPVRCFERYKADQSVLLVYVSTFDPRNIDLGDESEDELLHHTNISGNEDSITFHMVTLIKYGRDAKEVTRGAETGANGQGSCRRRAQWRQRSNGEYRDVEAFQGSDRH